MKFALLIVLVVAGGYLLRYLLRSDAARDRKKILESLDLDAWLNLRYAVRYNTAKERYELLDFIRWEEDTQDDAHCLYVLSDIRRDEDEDCLVVTHSDKAEQKIYIDRSFGFKPEGLEKKRQALGSEAP